MAGVINKHFQTMQRAVEEDDIDFVREQIASGRALPDMILMDISDMPHLADLAIQHGSLRVLAFLLSSRVSLAPVRVASMHQYLERSRDPNGVLRTFADSPHPSKNMFFDNIPAAVLKRIVVTQQTFEYVREKTGLLVVAQRTPVQPRDEREGETKTVLVLNMLSSQAHDIL
jgi:hypothetical protein